VPAHHPFTMPHADDLDRLASDPLAVRSLAYDLVLNGWELGSGSVRIHRRDIQQRIFAALGLSEEESLARFGFLLDAFRYGAPPHAGFAFGIDRLAAIFAGEENIREVIAFPKTQSGADPLTGAPKALAPGGLAELGLRAGLDANATGAVTARRGHPATERGFQRRCRHHQRMPRAEDLAAYLGRDEPLQQAGFHRRIGRPGCPSHTEETASRAGAVG